MDKAPSREGKMSGFHDCEPDRCNYCNKRHATEDCPSLRRAAKSESIFWDEYPDNGLPLPEIGPCMKHGRMRCTECCDELAGEQLND